MTSLDSGELVSLLAKDLEWRQSTEIGRTMPDLEWWWSAALLALSPCETALLTVPAMGKKRRRRQRWGRRGGGAYDDREEEAAAESEEEKLSGRSGEVSPEVGS